MEQLKNNNSKTKFNLPYKEAAIKPYEMVKVSTINPLDYSSNSGPSAAVVAS